MKYTELLITALSALKSNLMRTILTMLGIIIGIASVILIIALVQGATSSVTSSFSSLGANLLTISPGSQQERGPVQSGSSVQTLTYEDSTSIKSLSNISAVSASVSTRKQVSANGENTNVSIQGISSDYQTIQSIEMQYGEFVTETDEEGYSKVAVLGTEVVTDLFGEDTDPTGEPIIIDGKSFRVVGVTKSKGTTGFSNPDATIYIPVTTAMTILLGQKNVANIQVLTDSPESLATVTTSITELLSERHNISDGEALDFNIGSSQDALSSLESVTTTLTAMLGGIAGISLVVGGIGIMNIMLVTVTERTKEIGLLKAIGAKKIDILTQFLIEAIVLTLTGGIIGIILGESLAVIVSSLLGLPFVFQFSSILLAVGVSTVIGVLFGLYPAQRAAKLSPIDALRYD
jgi:putative ABC transport system permease protein